MASQRSDISLPDSNETLDQQVERLFRRMQRIDTKVEEAKKMTEGLETKTQAGFRAVETIINETKTEVQSVQASIKSHFEELFLRLDKVEVDILGKQQCHCEVVGAHDQEHLVVAIKNKKTRDEKVESWVQRCD